MSGAERAAQQTLEAVQQSVETALRQLRSSDERTPLTTEQIDYMIASAIARELPAAVAEALPAAVAEALPAAVAGALPAAVAEALPAAVAGESRARRKRRVERLWLGLQRLGYVVAPLAGLTVMWRACA